MTTCGTPVSCATRALDMTRLDPVYNMLYPSSGISVCLAIQATAPGSEPGFR
jgi:hypothetical protein